MFSRTRTDPLDSFAYRTLRARVFDYTPTTPVVETFIYNGGTSGSSTYSLLLNGQTSSFISWQNTIIPPDASGAYAEA